MANSTVVSNIIKTLGGFTIGVAVTTGLHTFNGTDALNTSKSNVEAYVQGVQNSMSELEEFASSNKSISDANNQAYQEALNKANSNINQLISYISNMTATETELQNKVNQYETDLAELQAEFDNLQANVDSQVQGQVDDVIAKANEQIDKANNEVNATTSSINETLANGAVDTSSIKGNSITAVSQDQLAVTDISSIVGGSSQTPTTPQEPSVQEPTQTPSDTPSVETGKSEETPSLHITGRAEPRVDGNDTIYGYSFSDGTEWEVTLKDFKVNQVLVECYGQVGSKYYLPVNETPEKYAEFAEISDMYVEFMEGGYLDLINNY